MLMVLDYNISQTTASRFLERYVKILKCDSVCLSLAQYLLELALLDSKMNQFIPSEQAASAILVSKSMLGMEMNFKKLEKHSGYTQDTLRQCSKCLQTLNNSIQSSQLKAVYRKFKRSRFLEVAKLASNAASGQGVPPSNNQSDHQKKA